MNAFIQPAYTPDIVRNALQNYFELRALILSVPSAHCDKDTPAQPYWHCDTLHCVYLDVRRALLDLPKPQRQAVLLHYILGYPQDQVALRLRVTQPAIALRLRRAVSLMTCSLNKSGRISKTRQIRRL
jgi:DNA-directed RNA polymerase specialized sigma24 family protein